MQAEHNEKSKVDFRLHGPDFDRKMVFERDMDKLPNHLLNIKTCFDEYEQLIYIPSLFGILVYNIGQSEFVQIIGKEERNERFMSASLYQGKPMADTSGQTGKGGVSSQQKEFDPCLFTTSYKKLR